MVSLLIKKKILYVFTFFLLRNHPKSFFHLCRIDTFYDIFFLHVTFPPYFISLLAKWQSNIKITGVTNTQNLLKSVFNSLKVTLYSIGPYSHSTLFYHPKIQCVGNKRLAKCTKFWSLLRNLLFITNKYFFSCFWLNSKIVQHKSSRTNSTM